MKQALERAFWGGGDRCVDALITEAEQVVDANISHLCSLVRVMQACLVLPRRGFVVWIRGLHGTAPQHRVRSRAGQMCCAALGCARSHERFPKRFAAPSTCGESAQVPSSG